jgi:malate/lactate dehydrogenase
VAGANGISRVVEIPLSNAERTQLTDISKAVQQQVQGWMAAATPVTVAQTA